MECKNCQTKLQEEDQFCNSCGAKVIKERITFRSLLNDLIVALGWDSRFIVTLRQLILHPENVLSNYINGTRKRYTNPFTFFGIIAGFSVFFFNLYSDKLIQITSEHQIFSQEVVDKMNANNANHSNQTFDISNQKKFMNKYIHYQLKYYNIIAFLSLPFIVLIAFIVFGKPYNYGEHFVINVYLNAVTILFSSIIFIFTVVTGMGYLTDKALFFSMIYYSYAYGKLYKLSLLQILLKFLKFVFVSSIFMIIIIIISLLFVMVKHYLF